MSLAPPSVGLVGLSGPGPPAMAPGLGGAAPVLQLALLEKHQLSAHWDLDDVICHCFIIVILIVLLPSLLRFLFKHVQWSCIVLLCDVCYCDTFNKPTAFEPQRDALVSTRKFNRITHLVLQR